VRRYGFAGVIVGCALALLGLPGLPALPALAQQGQNTGQFFNGANPRDISFKVPPSTARAMRSMNMRAMQTPSTGKGTPNLSNYFPRQMSLGTWPPKVPNVFILDKSPYQPNPPKGKKLLDLLKPGGAK
jgi:hypothetical protein